MMRKNFRFALEINGIIHALIQEITPPSREFAEIVHGAAGNNPDAKTAGKLKVGDLVVKKLKPEGRSETWMEDWMAQVAAAPYTQYARNAFLLELAPDAITPIDKYYLGGIWPKKLDPSGYKTGADGENIMETCTFSVQHYFNTSSPQWVALFGGSAASAGGLAATLGKL